MEFMSDRGMNFIDYNGKLVPPPSATQAQWIAMMIETTTQSERP